MNIHTITSQVGSNPITFETGKLAKLADGAVVVSSGETTVLVTAVSQTKVREGEMTVMTVVPDILSGLDFRYAIRGEMGGLFPSREWKRRSGCRGNPPTLVPWSYDCPT